LFCDKRATPPSLTDRTAYPGLELLSCELLANLAAVADVLVLNVHKTPSGALSLCRQALDVAVMASDGGGGGGIPTNETTAKKKFRPLPSNLYPLYTVKHNSAHF